MKKRWIVSLSLIIAALTCSCQTNTNSGNCKGGKCACKCQDSKCGCPSNCGGCKCKGK